MARVACKFAWEQRGRTAVMGLGSEVRRVEVSVLLLGFEHKGSGCPYSQGRASAATVLGVVRQQGQK